ncbi:MAG: L-fuconolactonase [Candidatus Azotimanducaceae bacterium]|jgi:L-fuconolactonase
MGNDEWLALVSEEIIDPNQKIIDPHHHLWRRPGGSDYVLANLQGDTMSGHKVVKSVFVECHAEYRTDGPEHLKPLGETEFVVKQAEASELSGGTIIAGIVSHADLTLGDAVEAVLVEHEALGKGRFRGIRHAGAHAEFPEALTIAGRAPANLYESAPFREGVKKLGHMGYTFDTWHYHYQNKAFYDLARECPETQMILDHFGTPLGVGPYASQQDQIKKDWKQDIAKIAECENVVAKIGGLAMPDNGFGWEKQPRPPTSDEFAEAQREYYLHTIDCFGPDRCMFESNFPVDRMSLSYHVLYNGLKKIAKDFSQSEKDAMFFGTAARIYHL